MRQALTIGLIVVAMVLGFILTYRSVQEPFDTSGSFKASKEELDVCWKKILSYLQNNPDKADKFMLEAKRLLFKEALFKSPATDFKKLFDEYTPVFS
uniref:Uncharacterized protein n=1 Tax=viral metagenome TaxID=1070528 RepID=A0A6C0AQ79_9ZZZZ